MIKYEFKNGIKDEIISIMKFKSSIAKEMGYKYTQFSNVFCGKYPITKRFALCFTKVYNDKLNANKKIEDLFDEKEVK